MQDGFRRKSAFFLSASIPALALAALTGSALAQETPTLVDPITIVATKTEEKAIDTLAGVSTIRQDRIDQTMARKPSDLFAGLPGVWFQERGDDPGTAIIIRGLQDFGRVAVLIDGARQNFQRTGHNANGLFYFEPELLGGADVVRGPVSNIYGSGAIGGVVTMRTKDVEDVLKIGQRWGVLTNGMVTDNRGEYLGSAFGAVRVNPNVDVLVGGTYRDRASYRDGNGNVVVNSGNDTRSGLAKLTVRPADGHEVKLTGMTYDTHFFNGTPNATNTATVYDTTVKNNVATLGWRYQRPDDRLFDFDSKVYWTNTETDQTKVGGTNSAISGRLGSLRTFGIDTVGFDVNNTSRFDTGYLRHALTYGGDMFRDKVEVTDPTGTGDLFTPNGERDVGGAFAQLQSNYATWLQTIAAVRYDSYSMSGGTVDSSGDRLSPKFTLGITPVSFLTVYGTYAEGYRAPAITEVFVSGQHPFAGPGSNFVFLPNGTLQPEVGKTLEAGVNIRHDNLFTQNDALRIKANVFRNDVDDFIDMQTVLFGQAGAGGIVCTQPAPANCIQYVNVAQARIEGVELEGTYDAGFMFAGLSGSHIRGKNVDTNQPLLKIMPDQITGTLGARFLDRRLTAMVRVQAVAAKDREDIPSGTIPPTDAYTLVHTYLSYQPNEDMTLSFGIDNLFNEYYAKYLDVTTIGSATVASPSPGRTYKFGLKVRFGEGFGKS